MVSQNVEVVSSTADRAKVAAALTVAMAGLVAFYVLAICG